jgi:hypothetical protein
MKWWRLTLLVLLLVPPAIFTADIEKVGVWTWLREGWKQPGPKWFGWYFPRGWKTIGPLLYLALILFCVNWIRSIEKDEPYPISVPPAEAEHSREN